ncbi:MAG: caspase family protein [Bacteroidota bacterium]
MKTSLFLVFWLVVSSALGQTEALHWVQPATADLGGEITVQSQYSFVLEATTTDFDAVEIWIDGRVQPQVYVQQEPTGSGAQVLRFALKQLRNDQKHHIQVRLLAGGRLLRSKSTFITYRSELMPRTYVLLVGCKSFENWANLRNPLRDVEALEETLQKHYSGTIRELQTLRNPTFAEYQSALESLNRKASQENESGAFTQLLVYVSSHGTSEGFIAFKDSEPVSDFFVQKALNYQSLRSEMEELSFRHTFFVGDVCHAGKFVEEGVFDPVASAPHHAGVEEGMTRGEPLFDRSLTGINAEASLGLELSRRNEERTFTFLASGFEDVYDGEVNGNSPFCNQFLQMLEKGAASDSWYLYAQDFYEAADRLAAENQRPRLSRVQNIDGRFLLLDNRRFKKTLDFSEPTVAPAKVKFVTVTGQLTISLGNQFNIQTVSDFGRALEVYRTNNSRDKQQIRFADQDLYVEGEKARITPDGTFTVMIPESKITIGQPLRASFQVNGLGEATNSIYISKVQSQVNKALFFTIR